MTYILRFVGTIFGGGQDPVGVAVAIVVVALIAFFVLRLRKGRAG